MEPLLGLRPPPLPVGGVALPEVAAEAAVASGLASSFSEAELRLFVSSEVLVMLPALSQAHLDEDCFTVHFRLPDSSLLLHVVIL